MFVFDAVESVTAMTVALNAVITPWVAILAIGALTTHADLASSTVLKKSASALAEAAGQVGDPAVRNRGTIGGNIAHADPASDLPTVLVALGAQIVLAGLPPSGITFGTDPSLPVTRIALPDGNHQ